MCKVNTYKYVKWRCPSMNKQSWDILMPLCGLCCQSLGRRDDGDMIQWPHGLGISSKAHRAASEYPRTVHLWMGIFTSQTCKCSLCTLVTLNRVVYIQLTPLPCFCFFFLQGQHQSGNVISHHPNTKTCVNCNYVLMVEIQSNKNM